MGAAVSDIFISYKREEQPIASKLANALEGEGWSVWWDPKLRAGERFNDVIERALKGSKCVVVMWSKRSVESEYVKHEANYALRRNKLVPVMIEEVELPFRFEDLHTLTLLDWDGSKDVPDFRRLVEDIGAIVVPPATEAKRKAEEENRKRMEQEGADHTPLQERLIASKVEQAKQQFPPAPHDRLQRQGVLAPESFTKIAGPISERRILVIGSQCEALKPPLSFLPDVAEQLYRVMVDPALGSCNPALPVGGLLINPSVNVMKQSLRSAFELASRSEATLLIAYVGHADHDGEDFYLLPMDAANPP
jgi:hypothetical protein